MSKDRHLQQEKNKWFGVSIMLVEMSYGHVQNALNPETVNFG